MTDFEALVLVPSGNIHQIAVVYTPTVSQPGVLPFKTFGVFSSAPISVVMQDDAIFADQQTSLGVRLRSFAVEPMEGDHVTINEPTHWAYGKQFWIGNCDEDGQGGGMLLLRAKNPPDEINPYRPP